MDIQESGLDAIDRDDIMSADSVDSHGLVCPFDDPERAFVGGLQGASDAVTAQPNVSAVPEPSRYI